MWIVVLCLLADGDTSIKQDITNIVSDLEFLGLGPFQFVCTLQGNPVIVKLGVELIAQTSEVDPLTTLDQIRAGWRSHCEETSIQTKRTLVTVGIDLI